MLEHFRAAQRHFIASHQHPVNQILHHLTVIINLVGIVLLIQELNYIWISLGLLVISQVMAWGGHFWIEKNQPAAVRYPVLTMFVSIFWSAQNLFGLRMVLDWLRGKQSVKPSEFS